MKRKQLILKYNTSEHFEKDDEATYTVLEKAIFYSAFIIRKLIDCGSKLSDEADKYSFEIQACKPLQNITRLTTLNEKSHDWNHFQKKPVNGKEICNWLIHSYIFSFVWNEKMEKFEGFFVTSDFDRNKLLYYVDINNWIDYIDFIAKDSMVIASLKYEKFGKGKNKNKCDHVYKEKKRI